MMLKVATIALTFLLRLWLLDNDFPSYFASLSKYVVLHRCGEKEYLETVTKRLLSQSGDSKSSDEGVIVTIALHNGDIKSVSGWQCSVSNIEIIMTLLIIMT